MKQFHLCFVDDDDHEVQTFERLFRGYFQVAGVSCSSPHGVVQRVQDVLGAATPDLFVLDLYFPESDQAPGYLADLSSEERVRVFRSLEPVKKAVHELEQALEKPASDAKFLLRDAHVIVHRSSDVLSGWCKSFRQSPVGGYAVLEALNSDRRYRQVPKIFYSRKATLKDAREALSKGALDIVSKPDPSLEEAEASELGRLFERYCRKEPPSYLTKWMKNVQLSFGIGFGGPAVSVSINPPKGEGDKQSNLRKIDPQP